MMILRKKKHSEEMTTIVREASTRPNGTIVLDTDENVNYMYCDGWIRQGKCIKA